MKFSITALLVALLSVATARVAEKYTPTVIETPREDAKPLANAAITETETTVTNVKSWATLTGDELAELLPVTTVGQQLENIAQNSEAYVTKYRELNEKLSAWPEAERRMKIVEYSKSLLVRAEKDLRWSKYSRVIGHGAGGAVPFPFMNKILMKKSKQQYALKCLNKFGLGGQEQDVTKLIETSFSNGQSKNNLSSVVTLCTVGLAGVARPLVNGLITRTTLNHYIEDIRAAAEPYHRDYLIPKAMGLNTGGATVTVSA